VKDLYVDCVRRMEVSSAAKVFVLDDLLYETSAADDGICGPTPGTQADAGPPSAPRLGGGSSDLASESSSSSSAAARAPVVAAVATGTTAALLLLQARWKSDRRHYGDG